MARQPVINKGKFRSKIIRFLRNYKKRLTESPNKEEEIKINFGRMFLLLMNLVNMHFILGESYMEKYGVYQAIKTHLFDLSYKGQEDINNITFDDIRTRRDMTHYLELPLRERFRALEWSKEAKERKLKGAPAVENVIGNQNYQLSPIYFKLYTVRNNSCDFPIRTPLAILLRRYYEDGCYGYFSRNNSADKLVYRITYQRWFKARYYLYNSTMNPIWTICGKFGCYDGESGYTINFRSFRTRTSFGEISDFLKSLSQYYYIRMESTKVEAYGLFDRFTRAYVITGLTHNPYLNVFALYKIFFEMPPTGSVYASYSITPVKIHNYKSTYGFGVLGVEMTCLILIFFFLVETLKDVLILRMKFFRQTSTYLDLILCLLSIPLYPLFVYRIFFAEYRYARLFKHKEDQFFHTHLDKLVYWHVLNDDLLAFILFLSWIKFIRYFFFFRFVYPVITLLKKLLGLLVHYIPLFLLIWSAYSHLGFIWFGHSNELFGSFVKSFLTLFGIVIGFDDFVGVDEYFFFSYIVLFWIGGYYLLMHLVLAMFISLWNTTKKFDKRLDHEITTFEYLYRGYQNFKSCCRPRKPYKTDQVYRFSRIRFGDFGSFLRECNFTEQEINAFLRKFHLNNLGPITHCTDHEAIIRNLETVSFEPHIPKDYLIHLQNEVHKRVDVNLAKIEVKHPLCTTFAVKEGIRNKMYEIERDVEAMEAKLLQCLKILKIFKELGILQKRPRDLKRSIDSDGEDSGSGDDDSGGECTTNTSEESE